MTDEQYCEWAEIHAGLFRLDEEKDARTFRLWAPILMPFDFKELCQASYTVSQDPRRERGFREHHPSMLREAIMAQRAAASARENERLDALGARSECADCHGVGLVRVPHPEFVVDGWLDRGFFVVVACLCPLGNAKFNAINCTLAEAAQRMPDLAQYEAVQPDWRNILAAHRESQAIEFEAAELAREMDRAAPINLDDIRKAEKK